MNTMTITGLGLVALSTSGCATIAAREARTEAAAQCERQGKIFVEREAESRGSLVGRATVTGACLGPGDPGYEAAIAKPSR